MILIAMATLALVAIALVVPARAAQPLRIRAERRPRR